MRRYLMFASELYALPILRPLERAARARGEACAWVARRGLGPYLRDGERRLATLGEVRAWDPAAVFVPGNWVPAAFPGLKVEVFHGFDTGKRSERKGHYRIRGLFDLYCTQGPATTEPFRRLARRHGYFRVEETGWPKLDPLFGEPGACEGDPGPVVLYASTFNESMTSTRALFETIRRATRERPWRWLVTFHPKIAPDIVQRYRGIEGERLRYVETDDVIPLLRRADAMLCDTSSILHEFLVAGKPVVTFRNRAPGPQLIDVTRPEQVLPALARALERPPELMSAVEAHAAAIHPYRDGRSSERVLAAVDAFRERGRRDLRRKPFNVWRRVRARLRLREYGSE